MALLLLLHSWFFTITTLNKCVCGVNIRVRCCCFECYLLSNRFRIEFVLCVGWPEWMEPMLRRRFGVLRRCSGAGGRTERVVVTCCRCRFGAVALESEAQLGRHLRAEGDLRGNKKRLLVLWDFEKVRA